MTSPAFRIGQARSGGFAPERVQIGNGRDRLGLNQATGCIITLIESLGASFSHDDYRSLIPNYWD
jgi:hypothetical protein